MHFVPMSQLTVLLKKWLERDFGFMKLNSKTYTYSKTSL